MCSAAILVVQISIVFILIKYASAQDYCSEYNNRFVARNEALVIRYTAFDRVYVDVIDGLQSDGSITVYQNGVPAIILNDDDGDCLVTNIYRLIPAITPTGTSTTFIEFKKTYNSTITNQFIASANTTVVFQVPATISSVGLKSVTVTKNSNYEVNCTAIGNPPPVLRWNVDETSIKISVTTIAMPDYPEFNTNISSITTLQILNVQFNEKGPYCCNATNTALNDGQDEDSECFSLEVVDAVQHVNQSTDMELQNVENIALFCDFEGYPPPIEANWFRDDVIPIAGTKNRISITDFITRFEIVFSIADCSQNITVKCSATNYISNIAYTDSSEIFLYPKTPDVLSIYSLKLQTEDCGGSSLTVSWKTADEWLDHLTYHIRINGSGIDERYQTDSLYFIIESLAVLSTYTVKVYGESACGKTTEVLQGEATTGQISTPSAPQNVKSSVTYTQNMCYVKWEIPDITYENITSYMIYYRNCNCNETACSDTQSATTVGTEYSFAMEQTANKIYSVNVSSFTCAGEGEIFQIESSNCSTPYKPSNPKSNLDVVDSNGFYVNITNECTRNNKLLCYAIVLENFDETDSSSNTPISCDDVVGANEDVELNIPYYEYIAQINNEGGPEEVFVGGGNATTSCSPVSGETIYAKSRNLTQGGNYKMYTIAMVADNTQDKKYTCEQSNGVQITVKIPFRLCGFGYIWCIIIPIIVVIIIIVVVCIIGVKKHKIFFKNIFCKKVKEDEHEMGS